MKITANCNVLVNFTYVSQRDDGIVNILQRR